MYHDERESSKPRSHSTRRYAGTLPQGSCTGRTCQASQVCWASKRCRRVHQESTSTRPCETQCQAIYVGNSSTFLSLLSLSQDRESPTASHSIFAIRSDGATALIPNSEQRNLLLSKMLCEGSEWGFLLEKFKFLLSRLVLVK